MKRILLLLILQCSFIPVFAQDATLIYKNTVNSTITIETPDGLGSGFFVGENIIATNYHVIKGDTEAYCYTNNSDTKYKIEGYVAVDTSVDLILLKVSGLKRTPIRISNTLVEIGQKIYVIGSPKGLPTTISDGIVSGLRDFDGYKLIQITAPISHGSSGGPVLNSKGELIGVSVASLKEGQNLNFAIPKAKLKILMSNKSIHSLSLSSLAFDEEIANLKELPENPEDLKKDSSTATEQETIDWITSIFKEYASTLKDEWDKESDKIIIEGSIIHFIQDFSKAQNEANDIALKSGVVNPADLPSAQILTESFDLKGLTNYEFYSGSISLYCKGCVVKTNSLKKDEISYDNYLHLGLSFDDSMVKRLTKALDHLKQLTTNSMGKF